MSPSFAESASSAIPAASAVGSVDGEDGGLAAAAAGDAASGAGAEASAFALTRTPNYVRHMATDLEGITELSTRMPAVLHDAPTRLDRRRLWRARQAIDLEPLTERRAARQLTAPEAAPNGGLRWRPLSTNEVAKVLAAHQATVGPDRDAHVGLLDMAAENDQELLIDLLEGRAV